MLGANKYLYKQGAPHETPFLELETYWELTMVRARSCKA